MPKVNNIFVNGRMDSDTHRSLTDIKSYRYAKNLRPFGEGEDGAMKFMKGSLLVSSKFTDNGMQCVGMHEGNNNKMYYFLAHSNGKSKIVEYDTESKTDRLIIEDNTVLRFDLIRWKNGVEIFPYKYLLGVDQVGDNLIFSDEVWEDIRCVNLKNPSDYADGFTIDDIRLAKKPPKFAPQIISRTFETEEKDNEDNNKFISFAYRYKYSDGQFSTLSFYSDVAFQERHSLQFEISTDRYNTTMVNTVESIELMVDSGSKSVTDIEVYAREHGSNTAYLIYSVNKKEAGIQHNSYVTNIKYSYSTNYPVLDEQTTKMLSSNFPRFPKTQTGAGSRLLWANYKEGFDIDVAGGVNFNTRKKVVAPSGTNNTTAVSMFKYKVGVVYLNDYNESTTPLLPIDQFKAEIQTNFNDRLHRNLIEVTDLTPPPSWATKMKFVVKSDELNYENLYITYAKKIGLKTYLLLTGDNIQRVRKDDVIFRTDSLANNGKEYKVLDVKSYDIDDGLPIKGVYAYLETENDFVFEKTSLPDVNKKYDLGRHTIDGTVGSNNPQRFVSVGAPYSTNNSRYWNLGKVSKSDVTQIKEGDVVSLNITIDYQTYDTAGSSAGFQDQYEILHFNKEMYASQNYDNPLEFFKNEFNNPYFDVEESGNDILFRTNSIYPDYVKEKAPRIYEFTVHKDKGGRGNIVVATVCKSEVRITRGIKPIYFRTKNQELINEFYFETTKDYPIVNGEYIGDYIENGKPVFEIGFYNGYSWGNGIESYKVKDAFNAKKLHHNFRGTAVLKDGYKRTHRPYDITYGGIYNYELGINDLGVFDASLANWKTLPFQYGAIQRIISTDSDITVFMPNKVINLLYGKSLIMDLRGNESVGLSNEVLGDYQVLPYEFGISYNPESVATASNLVYFTDKQRSRILIKAGNEIRELNAPQSGKHRDYVDMLNKHSSFLGSYDDAHGEFVLGIDNKFSIVHSMTSNGFPFETENKFDFLLGMNGKYYTAYNGKIYENEVTEDYNDFAGQGNFEGKLTFVVNHEMDSDKVFKAMQIQSNTAWNTSVKTNLTSTKFSEDVYQKRESYYFTDIFRDSSTLLGIVGAGSIISIQDNTITFNKAITNQISVGDYLSNKDISYKSEIVSISKNEVKVANASGFNTGDFAVGLKKQNESFRPNGVPMRGKWMEVTLSKSGNEPYYISAVYTEVIKSQLT